MRESYVKTLDAYTHLVIVLFEPLRHYGSLRELEIGMKADEANKLQELGLDYVVRRNSLVEAKKQHSESFLAKVYHISYCNATSPF